MFNKEIIDTASHVNLADYLMSHGEDLKKSGQGYTLKQHDSLRFYKNTFHWYSKNLRGNSINFLRLYYGMTFTDAVNELLRFANVSPVENSTFQDRGYDERRVIAYLCKKRGIRNDIVIHLIKRGLLFQDEKGNCNFVIRDWDEQPIGSEIVGTGNTRYKQITTHAGFGFHIICGNPDDVLFFESAIDLLSCYQLYQKDFTHHALVSMGGLNSSLINDFLSLGAVGTRIWLCVDNDKAGDDFINHVKQLSVPFKVFRTKNVKDWNEFLLKIK